MWAEFTEYSLICNKGVGEVCFDVDWSVCPILSRNASLVSSC